MRPTELEVTSALRAAQKKLSRRTDAEALADAERLRRVIAGKFLVDGGGEDPSVALAQAAIAVARHVPPGTTHEQMHTVLLASAASLADRLPEIIPLALSTAATMPRVANTNRRERMPRPAGEPSTDDEIRARLIPSANGGVRACGANIETVLRHSSELRDRVRWNELRKRVEITGGRFAGEGVDGLPTGIANWLGAEWELYVKASDVGTQLLRIARTWHSYNPVAEYLDSLEWDGRHRIGGWSLVGGAMRSGWLSDYCGSPVDEHTSRVGAMFLIGAVARALAPGADCKHDCVLTLLGRQGRKKSTAFKVLGGAYFTDTPIKLGDKDGYMVASAAWFVELAELASLADAEHQYDKHKAFLSAAQDLYRPPYGSALEWFPRLCVFAGTTNADEYLGDETGNRRHWSAWVERVDIEALARDRDQLFAEAVWRFRAGEVFPRSVARPSQFRWWLEDHEQRMSDEANEDRTAENPWADEIMRWVAKQPPGGGGWSLADVASGALQIPKERLSKNQMRVGTACKAAGLVRDASRLVVSGVKQPRLWRRG